MNPHWEALWRQDLERRAAEPSAQLERYLCLVDAYKAKVGEYAAVAERVGEYAAVAERAGFTADHPLVKQMLASAEQMKLAIPHSELPKFNISAPPIPTMPSPPLPGQTSAL